VVTQHHNDDDNDDNVKNVSVCADSHFNENDDYNVNKAQKTQLTPTLHCSI
jgi:hypothetical protein